MSKEVEEVQMALEKLKAALNDPDWEVRALGIQALGEIGDQLIIAPLKHSLDDPNFTVRSVALHMLGTFKACLPMTYLLQIALDRSNWITRDAAVTVLERVGESQLARPLRELLNRDLASEVHEL